MGAVLTMAVFCSGAVLADEIYRTVDPNGRVRYTNGPAAQAKDADAADPPPSDAIAADPPADLTEDAFSTEASLRRNALERDLRATEKQLRAVEERIAVYARARMRNAGGNQATGGVAGLAADVRSEEEKALAEQREQLVQRASEVRAAAAKLREEVTARRGMTPEWWVEVR